MRWESLGILTFMVIISLLVHTTDASWNGHIYTVRVSYVRWHSYCCSWFRWWGCGRRCYYYRTYYRYETRCKPGWRHRGDRNCIIPICRPTCANGGTCERPNVCDCPTTSQGPGCRQLTCSYKRPCFPGECNEDQTCTCEPGFGSTNIGDGCINFEDVHFESTNSTLAPVIGKSNVTLANIRRVDNLTNFMFEVDGTAKDFTDVVWINQNRFNNLHFEIESLFVQPDELPERPAYIHDAKMGVVHSQIAANVSKIPRGGGPIRDPGSFKSYECNAGFSRDNPAVEVATCEINDDQFITLIEHGDWLTVTFQSSSGGFQKLINLDQNGAPYATKYYKGLKDIKQVEFKFDFIAPRCCTEKDPFAPDKCPSNSYLLRVDEEFTKNPIRATWQGWQDDLSGVLEYYVEVFKLSPDPYERLVEMSPLQPVFNATVAHNDTIGYPEYRPDEPGMYSVLMQTSDAANNSRIARRLVLFDDKSNVSLNGEQDGKLYISSAVEETGYSWQTTTTGQSTTFVVNWEKHFINHIHVDGKLLNTVLAYPIQFEDIEDDGVLFSKKYVHESLDDFEGQRSRAKVNNLNGIVQFEMAKEFTESDAEPTTGWTHISPIAQTATFNAELTNGARARVWIRATDTMGNLATDSTSVRVDSTPPLVSNGSIPGAEHKVALNVKDGSYNYTSRLSFVASDDQSGVFKLGYNILIHTSGKDVRSVFVNATEANIGTIGNPLCRVIDGICFIPQQHLELNNCWFLISKADLDQSTATVEVEAYNQALLVSTTTFQVGKVTRLQGLEKYSGPTDLRITSTKDTGFQVSWTLPEKTGCYGVADIVILVTKQTPQGLKVIRTIVIAGTETHFDILGLDAMTEYGLSLGLRMPGGGEMQDTGVALKVKTDATQTSESHTGTIVGVVVGLLVVFILGILTVVILVRRGVIKPAERAREIRRAVTTRYRKTVRGGATGGRSGGIAKRQKSKPNTYVYDNRQSESELYIYGGMDESPQVWYLDRNDVTLETLIKSGHFANIYKAKLMTGRTPETVVAKTLKEGFTPDDEMLMRAKINFTGTVVGDHPNCLKFLGAVKGEKVMGPFIIYEYCENGTLKDYVDQHKNNVTIEVQDNFYRFGLDIAKGMEYLASKGVVHRRLAARNILLTFLNEAKIAGFGPQPSEDEEGSDQGKKERIPIKWMAPECMTSTKDATEKSDVWSYAVVLWEIFSLGETPFANVRSGDLPAKIKKGERLSKPENCDDTWYDVMRKCWTYEESRRPTFTNVRNQLDTMFVTTGDDFYYYQR